MPNQPQQLNLQEDSVIEWVTSSTLTSLVAGETSELYVKAQEVNSNYSIRYELSNGTLPAGITLKNDGTLTGSAEYNAVNSYQFTILATDVYGLTATSRTFTLNVTAYNDKQYTKIYVRPFLKQSSRNAYRDFINDDSIFPVSYIYRSLDPNFGVQQDIKMYLEFGIEKIPGKILITGTQSYWFTRGTHSTIVAIDKRNYPGVEYTPVGATITIQDISYTITQVGPDPTHTNLHLITFSGSPAIECADSFTIESYQGFMNKVMTENFYRRKLYFGDIKLAIAQDVRGNNLYEVIYADIIDTLVNKKGVSIPKQITQNNQTLYPASIANMKASLESVVLPNNTKISVNEYNMPRFMRTDQPGSYVPLGYVKLVPICYALPGQGFKVIDRIKNSGFDFKLLNFEVDRLVVEGGPNSNSAKYLIFDRQSLST